MHPDVHQDIKIVIILLPILILLSPWLQAKHMKELLEFAAQRVKGLRQFSFTKPFSSFR